MKNYIKEITAVITALCSMALPSVSAYSATVDECAEVARSYGVSESAIQSAYNAYYANPEKYTSEDFDIIIDTLHLYGTDSDSMIKAYFGITDTPSEPSEEPVQTETTVSESSQAGAVTTETTTKSETNTDFINMTIDQKAEYINSLPESERSAFIENLSTEERNSIIKQLPIDDKTELLSRFAEAGEQMGLNMTIDEITNDSVSLSVRNDEGVLVDQSSMGVIVEDTGYDYRMIFALVSAGIIASATGIYLIYRKISKDEKEHE